MSIYIRNGVWWCYITRPDGKRVRRSLKTADETKAQELHDKIKHELWRVEMMGDKPKHTLTEACVRWLNEKHKKKSLNEDKRYIKFFLNELPKNVTLERITADMVKFPVLNLRKKPGRYGKTATDATLNRYLAFMRSLLRAAEEWGWIDRAPIIKLLKEPRRRIRWLKPEEAARLIAELPEHWRPIVRFALATGLRKSNILNLRWEEVDMVRGIAWVHPDEAKGGRAIGVALNGVALDVLRAQVSVHPEFVFVNEKTGKPFDASGNKSWGKALKRAGIEDFRFHDLRHTWASWLVQSGVGLAELQEMGGWESVEMVRKYAHLAPDHLRNHAGKIDLLIGNFNQAIEKSCSIENLNATFTPHDEQETKTGQRWQPLTR